MGESIRKHEGTSSLGELIHVAVRRAIEAAVETELAEALGAATYDRTGTRRGYRHGTKTRTVTGPTGPVVLAVPRARLALTGGTQEWTSTLLPRYQRRLPEVNEAVMGTYLAGGNLRRLRGALAPLLKGAPLSKSAVSRLLGTLRSSLEAWRTRPLGGVDAVYLYLDALALRVRSGGKVVSLPVLGVVAVRADGQKELVSLELCGAESLPAWQGHLTDLVTRGLPPPVLCILDGHPGLRRAVAETWPRAEVQRCCVHKLRNLERKAPKHAAAEIRADFHRIVYATSLAAARTALRAFERKWAARCPGVVRSLQEGGEELLTFFRFPPAQWKTLRTTNVIERLNEEFRRRVKTQGSLPTEDSAVVLLFSLVASGQIRLRKVDGWASMVDVLRTDRRATA